MHSDQQHPPSSLPQCLAIVLLVAAAWPLTVAAAAPPQLTNGGYMQTSGPGNKTVPLPLKHTAVEAEIAGMVAAVQVTQTFQNPSARPIEAVYVFPLPERSAVYELTIRVGKKLIKGLVKKRAEARQLYEQAKARGKTAALLEQERPNIFVQHVANILPGEEIEVTLSYVEDLWPEGGQYTWVFPMVVGPRYMGAGRPLAGQQGSGWAPDTRRVPDASRISPALLKKGLRPGHDVSLRLRINGGVPLQQLRVVTHKAALEQRGGTAEITLAEQQAIPNKDFVVRYRLTGATPQAALLARRDARGGHFLLTIQPPARLTPEQRAPREHVFVLDTSGSMSGRPLARAKALVQRCLSQLDRGDTFQLILFAGVAEAYAARAQEASPANKQQALAWLKRAYGAGGTELIPALRLALGAPKDPGRARAVLFLSDGYIGYEHEVLRYIHKQGGGSTIFPLGVGSAVNRFLIEGMARLGGGRSFYLLDEDEPAEVSQQLVTTLANPSLTQLRLEWQGLQVSSLTPARLPDLFADQPVVVAGRYREGSQGTLIVRGLLGGKPFAQTLQLTLPDSPDAAENQAIPQLWARRQLASWSDLLALYPLQARSYQEKITRTALRYNLVSQFTSLVAVHKTQRHKQGTPDTAPVALPLPEGVEESAAPAHGYLTLHGYGGGDRPSGESYGYHGVAGGLTARTSTGPHVVVGQTVVMGSMDMELLRRVIRRNLNQVRYCYQQVLGRQPELRGQVVVRFVIAADGRVSVAQVTASTLNHSQAEACICQAVRRWQFPAVQGGGIVEVNYPFVFQPAPANRR